MTEFKTQVDDLGRVCTKCLTYKLWVCFGKKPNSKTGYSASCRDCYNREHNGRDKILAKFGIVPDEYDKLLAEQGGVCALCSGTEPIQGRMLAVDHCHATGRNRGLLCSNCNMGLGKFKDDPALLDRAANYLREYGERY